MADALRQKEHYETIHEDYEAHYYDATSLAYRRQYIYAPLFEDIDLSGKTVADLACGSGQNSLAVQQLFPGAKTVGYDLSPSACRDYRAKTGCEAHEIDLTTLNQNIAQHDSAMIIGGLHHCISDLPTTLQNVAAMVKPGGSFMMMEPNRRFILESARRAWYRRDRWFDGETEAALDHDEIATMAQAWFRPKRIRYFGGPGFFLILNSLVTRVPLSVKPYAAPPMFVMESAWNKLPFVRTFPCFLAVWERLPEPSQ